MLGIPLLDGINPASCLPRSVIGYDATCYSQIWSEVSHASSYVGIIFFYGCKIEINFQSIADFCCRYICYKISRWFFKPACRPTIQKQGNGHLFIFPLARSLFLFVFLLFACMFEKLSAAEIFQGCTAIPSLRFFFWANLYYWCSVSWNMNNYHYSITCGLQFQPINSMASHPIMIDLF